MKQILVMMAAVGLVGCSKDTPETSQSAEAEAQETFETEVAELKRKLEEAEMRAKKAGDAAEFIPADEKLIAASIFEKAVREELEKPEGKLTEADLENVTRLDLSNIKTTDEDLKGVAKLQNLTLLNLIGTQITGEGLKEVTKLQNLNYLIMC